MEVDWWAVLALIVMLIGLAGIFLPVVPGVALIWLAAVGYAVADGFTHVGPLALAALTLLGLLGVTAELWMSSLGGRVGGASWWSLLAMRHHDRVNSTKRLHLQSNDSCRSYSSLKTINMESAPILNASTRSN